MKNIRDIELTSEDFYDPVGFQWAYLGQKPHKKQEEVLLSPHKNKIIVCGRRSGKSQMIAGELIRGAVLNIYKRQMVIAPIYKQTLIVYHKINELMTKAKMMHDIDSYKLNPPKIIFKNGNCIEFGSADNPDSLRGEAYERIFLDESAFIKEGAMNAIKPLIYDFGAPVWETTTPWGKGEVWLRWMRGQKGDEDYGCFHYNYKDNPYLSDEGVKEIEKDIKEYGADSEYVQCEIYGNFIEDRDAYFKKELIEACFDDYELGKSIVPRFTYALGVDIAGEGEDESVFISVMTHGGVIVIHDIDFFVKNKPREIVGMVKILDQKYNYFKICMDKTGMGEGPVDFLRETLSSNVVDDFRVEPIRFTTQMKMDIYSNLKKLMSQGKIKFPKNDKTKKLIFQLRDLRYEIMASGDLKIHHSEKGHDDYPDALALACWACKDESGWSLSLF